MNIPFIGRRSGTASQVSDADRQKAERLNAAPKHGPRPGRPLSEGQLNRRVRRQQQRNAASAERRQRRQGFTTARRERDQIHNLLGVARVYFDGAGTLAMQANVRKFVRRQAEIASQRTGEPFETSLEHAEQVLRSVLAASRSAR